MTLLGTERAGRFDEALATAEGDPALVATSLVIAYLEAHESQRRAEWLPAARKARAWLAQRERRPSTPRRSSDTSGTTMGTERRFLADVRRALRAAAVPADAGPMQAYMKSAMPYYGVKKPARVAALRPLWDTHRYADWPALEGAARAAWDGATHREERYAVLDLLERTPHKKLQTPDALPCFAHLITSGAWWDYVDDVAGKKVCRVWLGAPDATSPVLRRWARTENLWLRRSAILAQLRAKERTDTALLTECIEAAIGEREFFLRKAIGWALRQYAYTDPAWVRAFVDARPALSPLSRREALKNL